MIHLVLAATIFARITVVDRPIPVSATVRDGQVFLPLRATFEALNSTVVYDLRTGVIEAKNILHTLRIDAKTNYVELDGQRRNPMPGPVVVGGEVYVPMKLAAEAMGAIVHYDMQQHLVSVNGSDHGNPQSDGVHAPKELNPPPNATVETSYPAISASLGDAVAQSYAVRLLLDGANVTGRARFDGRTIAYVPETPLPGGTHTVVFDGTLGTGQPFSTEWTFTTSEAPSAPCYGNCGYQFYGARAYPYAGGSWFNLTLIAPPNGSGFAQICSPNYMYPLWNGGSRWYRARIALPAPYAPGNCAINAVYISPNGQRIVVPIASGVGGIYLTGSPLNPIGSWGSTAIYAPVFPPYVLPGTPRRKPQRHF